MLICVHANYYVYIYYITSQLFFTGAISYFLWYITPNLIHSSYTIHPWQHSHLYKGIHSLFHFLRCPVFQFIHCARYYNGFNITYHYIRLPIFSENNIFSIDWLLDDLWMCDNVSLIFYTNKITLCTLITRYNNYINK